MLCGLTLALPIMNETTHSKAAQLASPPPCRALQQLERFYQERRERNPSYSLRAFARTVGIGPGALSEIFSRKRPLTVKVGVRIVDKLRIPEAEAREWIADIAQTELQRSAETQIGQLSQYAPQFRELDPHSPGDDEYRVIADWYHFAILSLIETKDFRLRYAWIAARLGISVEDAKTAVARLCRLGLVEKTGGRLVLAQSGCASTSDTPSRALRESYRESLKQAEHAIEGVPVDLRDFSSITLAMNPEKIPLAKVLFRSFRRFAAEVLETGDCQEVYSLNMQFIPLTRRIHEKSP